MSKHLNSQSARLGEGPCEKEFRKQPGSLDLAIVRGLLAGRCRAEGGEAARWLTAPIFLSAESFGGDTGCHH